VCVCVCAVCREGELTHTRISTVIWVYSRIGERTRDNNANEGLECLKLFTCALGVMDVRASLKLEHQPRV